MVRVPAVGIVAALLLAGAAPGATAQTAPLVPITVAVGQSVTVPAPGVGAASVDPTEVAEADVSDGQVTIRGLVAGTATVVLTAPDRIEARPVEVLPARPAAIVASPIAGCASPAPVFSLDPSHVAFHLADINAAWRSGGWNFSWAPSGAEVWAASALATPLLPLGVPMAPGVEAEWANRWELIAAEWVQLLGYRMPAGPGSITFGESTLGPIGELQASVGPMTFSSVALESSSAGFVDSARAGLRVGPVEAGYATGPAGGWPTFDVHAGSITVSAAVQPEQPVRAAVGLMLPKGLVLTGAMLPYGGWDAELALRLERGAAAARGGTSAPGAAAAAGCGP